jgi:hypothetical protein
MRLALEEKHDPVHFHSIFAVYAARFRWFGKQPRGAAARMPEAMLARA